MGNKLLAIYGREKTSCLVTRKIRNEKVDSY